MGWIIGFAVIEETIGHDTSCSDAIGEEAMTALRCLKAVHSNVIEDKRVDRIFLQVLLHDAGIADKLRISAGYEKASVETNPCSMSHCSRAGAPVEKT